MLLPDLPLRARRAIFISCLTLCACAPGSHLVYFQRSVPLPTVVTAAARQASVRDRLYLLETDRQPARVANHQAIQRALGGAWPEANAVWENLLSQDPDCRVASNFALGLTRIGRHANAFDTIRLALKACPEDEKIRWNFRTLARPVRSPRASFPEAP